MMRYVGLWHGGNSYAAPYPDDAEYFETIEDAKNAMRSRERCGYWQTQTFRNVFRPESNDLTPAAHSEWSGYIDLYRVNKDATEDDIRTAIEDGCGFIRLEFGPRGGIRTENG